MLDYTIELKWVLLIVLIYGGYRFTESFVDILIGLSSIVLIFSVIVATYIYYKLKYSSEDQKDYIMGEITNILKEGLTRRLTVRRLVDFGVVLWGM